MVSFEGFRDVLIADQRTREALGADTVRAIEAARALTGNSVRVSLVPQTRNSSTNRSPHFQGFDEADQIQKVSPALPGNWLTD